MNEFETHVRDSLHRIEMTLLAIVRAIAPEDDDEDVAVTFDGESAGAERQPGQSLG